MSGLQVVARAVDGAQTHADEWARDLVGPGADESGAGVGHGGADGVILGHLDLAQDVRQV